MVHRFFFSDYPKKFCPYGNQRLIGVQSNVQQIDYGGSTRMTISSGTSSPRWEARCFFQCKNLRFSTGASQLRNWDLTLTGLKQSQPGDFFIIEFKNGSIQFPLQPIDRERFNRNKNQCNPGVTRGFLFLPV